MDNAIRKRLRKSYYIRKILQYGAETWFNGCGKENFPDNWVICLEKNTKYRPKLRQTRLEAIFSWQRQYMKGKRYQLSYKISVSFGVYDENETNTKWERWCGRSLISYDL